MLLSQAPDIAMRQLRDIEQLAKHARSSHASVGPTIPARGPSQASPSQLQVGYDANIAALAEGVEVASEQNALLNVEAARQHVVQLTHEARRVLADRGNPQLNTGRDRQNTEMTVGASPEERVATVAGQDRYAAEVDAVPPTGDTVQSPDDVSTVAKACRHAERTMQSLITLMSPGRQVTDKNATCGSSACQCHGLQRREVSLAVWSVIAITIILTITLPLILRAGSSSR